MTIFTMVINALLILSILWMVYRDAHDRHKRNRRVVVHIDETNKVAFISPRPKASERDVNLIANQLYGSYETVLEVENEIILKRLREK